MKALLFITSALMVGECLSETTPQEKSEDGYVSLFNGENLDGWYLKIRSGDEEMAQKVFSVEDGMVRVFGASFPERYKVDTGENDTHGMMYTEKKFSRYIFQFEYKWGTRIANNFARWQYDAGCFYHVTDDEIWPTGIEYQVRYDHMQQRNHTGDLIRPKGVAYQWICNAEGTAFLHPSKGGKPAKGAGWEHAGEPTKNFQALNDKWNRCEIIVMGDQYTVHKLNGEVINIAVDLSPGEGVIGLQAETAEIFYRNIRIKELSAFIPMEDFLTPEVTEE
ncbi:3-keto-disaccharide hydrolase [Rubritalea sp.]|uniref:3-keto-disaccharide hydrolase n=1 Tax=Rubritalea sp. TaxID=2109375 RepID=UPI003EF2F068